MEVEPWMLLAYMIGGICFFLFISTQLMPRYASKRIMKELHGEVGKAIMKEIIFTAIESMGDEIEIDGVPDANGKPTKVKTTLGAYTMGLMSQQIVAHLKMSFLGEKGNLSKEFKNMAGDIAIQGLPEQFRPMAALMMPMLKKYPVLSGIMGMAQAWMQLGGKLPPQLATTQTSGNLPRV